MIQVNHFLKKFATFTVLDIAEFQIPYGLNYVVGANGAGKTTLLRVLAGLSPFVGQVTLFGDLDLKKDPVRHRQLVNFSEAEPAFPAFARGEDLVDLFLRTKKGQKDSVKAIIERFQMNSFLKTPIGTYSAGMKKKLSLLLAFIGQPKLIILDEPLITIDGHSRKELLDLIVESSDAGINFLISSHLAVDLPALDVNPVLEIGDTKIEIASQESINTYMPQA